MDLASAKGYGMSEQYYNKQIAPTVAKILGVKFEPNHPDAGTAITF